MSIGERRSRRSRTLASIFVVAGLFTLFTPPKAVHAFATVVTDVGTACTTTGQLCEPPFPLDLAVATDERLQVNYVVPPSHCSSVRLHLFVDRELRLTTNYLGYGYDGAEPPFDTLPLETGLLDLGPVSPGEHLLEVQAEGQVSGCNPDGRLEGWGGTLHVVTTPLSCTADACLVQDKEAFLVATEATAATGTDTNGDPLPLPDLGQVQEPVTIGNVTFRSPQLFVGTGGDPRVENGDWTLLLDGPDIALAGPGPMKRLEVRFAEPVYGAGFDFVEPETGPNVGRRFSDADFTVELKQGNRTVRELAFSPPNDVPTFVGTWSDVAFDHITIRSVNAFGKKIFGRVFATPNPVFHRPPDILVVDSGAGTDNRGALFRVSTADGFRTLLNDFGDAQQGQPGFLPTDVAVEASGKILVIDATGLLFRIDPTTKVRLPLSDFSQEQNPGLFPTGVAVEANGNILVVDPAAGTNNLGALFRVNPGNGNRTLLSNFGQGQNPGRGPRDVAVEANGNILVVDSEAGTNFKGMLFRVNPGNGTRTVVSDFGSFNSGPLGSGPSHVAVEADGNILVTDWGAGTDGRGLLFRVKRTTGERSVLHDFGIPLPGFGTGLLGREPRGVAVEASGRILVVDPDAGASGRGQLFTVNRVTGVRTPLSNFALPSQGPLGENPIGVAVLRR